MALLKGFHVGNSHSPDLLVSHLLFADDTLIFCSLCESYLGYLICIISLFEAISGLRVNLSKSSLIPIEEVPNIHWLALSRVSFLVFLRIIFPCFPYLRLWVTNWKLYKGTFFGVLLVVISNFIL